ncbi:hypothetical protein GCM10010497_37410 [Streptomyces cinereoruber]|uniref:Uncharacterized protein n=1 Tax=Streptomyces cinereoruber TaxID=67260 RepID=A0AAV4KKJ7_9ACTN|nr:hypothetical protein GCM10010497_37410 [Streptomyces cinereoruber]
MQPGARRDGRRAGVVVRGRAVGVVHAEHLRVARVVRRDRVRVLLPVRVAEVLRLAVGPLSALRGALLPVRRLPLALLGPLLPCGGRRGRVVPVRRLLRLSLRGAVVPAASVPESSHVNERTRFRRRGAPLRLTCDIP